MIHCQGLAKSFAGRVLFEEVDFQIDKGERVGLLGRNGSGKSTLIKILTGEESSDKGKLQYPTGYRIGHLKQMASFSCPSVMEEVRQVLALDGSQDYLIEKTMEGLGFNTPDLQRDPTSFSSGQQLRINLAKTMLSSPDLLILDEPTNYLDILSVRWLATYLKQWKGEIILVSHDRHFLDQVVTSVMGIKNGRLRKIKGNSSQFYRQVEEELEVLQKTQKNQEKKQKEMKEFISKFRAKARQAGLVQSRIKQLEKLESVEIPQDDPLLNFQFHFRPYGSKNALEIENLDFGYSSQSLLIQNLNCTAKKGEVLGVIGKNGKGKSTLLNILAGELKPLNGNLKYHPHISIGHFSPHHEEDLYSENTIESEILQANPKLTHTQVRNICGAMLFAGDAALKQIKVLSGGEKARVLLGKVLASEVNLLLLDEPTNHLDIESIEALKNAIRKFEGLVVLVTHNEDLLASTAEKLLVFSPGGINFFNGTYNEFLEKIGWDEDSDKNFRKKSSKEKNNKKLRADLVREKNKKLKPLKEKCSLVEEKIIRSESLKEDYENMLIKLSQGDTDIPHDSGFLSREINILDQEIEKLFVDFENLGHQMGVIEEEFLIEEEKLKEGFE